MFLYYTYATLVVYIFCALKSVLANYNINDSNRNNNDNVLYYCCDISLTRQNPNP